MSAAPRDPWGLRCPRCGARLTGVRAGQLTLASAMLRWEDDGSLSARCPADGCSGLVPVPFLSAPLPPEPEPPVEAPRPRRRVLIPVAPPREVV